MKFLLKIIFLTFNVSLLAGGTPLEIEISFGAGYDDNAMRFSDNELSEAAQEIEMMGGAKTFDSFITKWGISALKELMINRKNLSSLEDSIPYPTTWIPRKRDIGQVDLICRIGGVPIEILNTLFGT